MLLGVGLLRKFLFVGAHSNPGPAGSTPPKGRNSLNNLAGASKQMLLLGLFCIAQLYFGGLTSPWGLQGPPHKMGGICFENWAGASKQKLLLAVGLQSKILFLRVHLTPGPTHSKGVFALPSSAVLKPAQAGLVFLRVYSVNTRISLSDKMRRQLLRRSESQKSVISLIFLLFFISVFFISLKLADSF